MQRKNDKRMRERKRKRRKKDKQTDKQIDNYLQSKSKKWKHFFELMNLLSPCVVDLDLLDELVGDDRIAADLVGTVDRLVQVILKKNCKNWTTIQNYNSKLIHYQFKSSNGQGVRTDYKKLHNVRTKRKNKLVLTWPVLTKLTK